MVSLEGIDKTAEQVVTLGIMALIVTLGMSSRWIIERLGSDASFWDRVFVTFWGLILFAVAGYLAAKAIALAGGVIWSRTRREAYKHA